MTIPAMPDNRFTKVSESPTRPTAAGQKKRAFDVADLYRTPLGDGETAEGATGLDERLRQAYFWIINTIILCGFTFTSVHIGRANSMYYFKDKDDIKSIVVHAQEPSRYNPVYYSGHVLCRWRAFKTNRDFLWNDAIQSKEYLNPAVLSAPDGSEGDPKLTFTTEPSFTGPVLLAVAVGATLLAVTVKLPDPEPPSLSVTVTVTV